MADQNCAARGGGRSCKTTGVAGSTGFCGDGFSTNLYRELNKLVSPKAALCPSPAKIDAQDESGYSFIECGRRSCRKDKTSYQDWKVPGVLTKRVRKLFELVL